ncbi:DUF3530 family protein [Neptuniibacter halophilus]|uniref:DUF3530 family protein n=1 Tax=Neptuniibacter halophilus TaxID=651666 RepID=UPI002573CC3A|nr:DUF3530 family protein [Neptuniibacter halophilus]
MKLIVSTLSLTLALSTLTLAADETDSAASVASGAQASNAPVERTEPNPERNRLSNLALTSDPLTEVLQLDTGKDGEQLLAFYRTEGTGITQGGVILFPDEQTHMDWPDDLSHLRQGLSDHGWYTLALYLPDSGINPLPERTLPVLSAIKVASSQAQPSAPLSDAEEGGTPDTAENASAPAENTPDSAAEETKEPEEAYQEKVYRLGSTAITHLKQQGPELDRFIVLGVGSGAVWAADFVRKYQEQEELRLVMIDARQPRINAAPDLLTVLPEINSTMIDLYHGQPVSLQQDTNNSAEQRLRLARHKRLNNFHQSRLPVATENWKKDSRWLVKQVRGLIRTYIVTAEKEARERKLNAGSETMEKGPG